MAQTPLTSASPYLTAARFWLYRDARPVLELLADDDTLPTQSQAEDATGESGGRLAAALARASGDVERYALLGKKYQPADLSAIVAGGGNAAGLIEGLVADLAFWHLAKRRYPSAKAEDYPGAKDALDALKELRDGGTIFGTVEDVAAELPDASKPDASKMPGGGTINRAGRLFGDHGTDDVRPRRGC